MTTPELVVALTFWVLGALAIAWELVEWHRRQRRR